MQKDVTDQHLVHLT